MSSRPNILARLRRWRSGARRFVAGSFAVAYLSAGFAPCVAAAVEAPAGSAGVVRERDGGSHGGHEHRLAATPDGHAVAGGEPPAGDHGHGSGPVHCPHCSGNDGGAGLHHDSHASCSTLEDLSNAATSQSKQVQQALAPLLAVPAFTLPPPLASPNIPPSMRAERIPPLVPLNLRHCLFLI